MYGFLYDESAATAVEMALMLCLIIVVILVAVVQVGQQAMAVFTTTGNAVGSGS